MKMCDVCSAQVMGNADYHPNPCVIICPFATCKKSHRVLNGIGAVSQLYSHWKEGHKVDACHTAPLMCKAATELP